MKDQLELLRTTDWDVLVILDACRADALRRLAPAADTVRSPGNCTPEWIARVAGILEFRGVTYFHGNPVVDREMTRLDCGVQRVSLWERLWGRFTRLGIPTVHPLCITGAVLAFLEPGVCPSRSAAQARPIVVHYVQPHSPYIGDVPLAMCRCGRDPDALSRACHALTRPDVAVAEGKITWPEVREAYMANLRLVWEAVRVLVAGLPGRRVIVTSDHGELLGEHGGLFGHEAQWRFDELFQVPWLELAGGATGGTEDASTHAKLKALGYE